MRRNSLAALPLAQRFVQGAIALVMIAVVLGLAYWIGLMLGGHT
jgi:lipopolysaccharide export LptBFGC system permease protein LptF